MDSFQHYFTIRSLSGTISPMGQNEVIKNVEEVFISAIVVNDSKKAEIECYVNTDDNPFILLPKEELEFEFTVTTIIINNLSTTDSADYRVFLKERVKEYTAP